MTFKGTPYLGDDTELSLEWWENRHGEIKSGDKTVKAKEAADARPVMEELVTQRNRKRPVCPECVEQGRESGHWGEETKVGKDQLSQNFVVSD